MESLTVGRKTKKTLLFAMLILCLLLPLLNHFALQLFYALEIDGNVAYKGFAPVVLNVIEFFNAVAVFSSYAVVIYPVMHGTMRDTKPLLILGSVCTVLMQLLPLGVAYFSLTENLFSLNAKILLLNVLLNILIFLLLFFAVFAIAAVVRIRWGLSDKNKNVPVGAPIGNRIFSLKNASLRTLLFSALLYFGVALAQAIPATAAEFSEYGLPMNMNELVYILDPYVTSILYFFIGYFVMVGLFAFFDRAAEKDTVTE